LIVSAVATAVEDDAVVVDTEYIASNEGKTIQRALRHD